MIKSIKFRKIWGVVLVFASGVIRTVPSQAYRLYLKLGGIVFFLFIYLFYIYIYNQLIKFRNLSVVAFYLKLK